MSVHLALGYGLVGVGIAAWASVHRHRLGTDLVDVLLLSLVWPLYGPLLMLRVSGPAPRKSDQDPLAGLLPDPSAARALGEQLGRARGKVRDIDALLSQQEFDREHAAWHQQKLLDAGQTQAAARVDARIGNIERLHGLRARYAEQLAEVEELLVQLRLQAAVVSLSGWDDESRDLVDTLLARVQSLDALMEESML